MRDIEISLVAKRLDQAKRSDVGVLTVKHLGNRRAEVLKEAHTTPPVFSLSSSSLIVSRQWRPSILPVPSSNQYTLFVVWVEIETTWATTVTYGRFRMLPG